MLKEDKARIIHGEVNYRNQWMTIEKKVDREKKRRKKIEQGLVFYQGEWITIEEKIARVSPAQQQQQQPQQININQTFNQQTYDQRTTVHEHKHLHLDAETLTAYAKSKGLGAPPDISIEGPTRPAISGKRGKKGKALSDKTGTQYLPDKSQTHYLEDKSGEEIVEYVEEVDVEELKVETSRPVEAEVHIEDLKPEKKDKKTSSKNPAENCIDLENISDKDVEEFLG